MSIISIKNLIHRYARRDDYGEKIGTVSAIDDVSLDVQQGDFISILGRNGSGKSTLAKHINALLSPTEGKVYVCGYDTENEELILDIRKSAGMVFQNPDNQIIATVVEEDVAFGPENIGVKPSEIRQRVDNSLEATGMSAYAKHSPNRLSGGQKQRVAIAGVLAMNLKCIILDEPTAMLDPVGRKEVISIVRKLNREEGITVILVTHYMDEVIESDKVYVMDEGKIVRQGSPVEVFADISTIKSLGLDVPQVTEVADLLRRRGYQMPVVLTVEDFAAKFEALLKDGNIKNTRSRDVESGAFETGQFEPHYNTSDTLISLRNVYYTYSPDTAFRQKAVENINIDIRKNEFIALIGHTGSGKSTLIQMLNGLLKPTSGVVLFKGEDINSEKYNRKELRGKVGLAFQYAEHQLFETTIYKDVAFGPSNQGLNKEEVDERVKNALNLVGISSERWNDSPLELSGGQKKRVAIAGVLAMKPEVLILDEPTAGLDPAGRDEILGQIRSIYEETGITVVLVSHSMEDVAHYADRVVVMNDGEIVYDDLAPRIFAHQRELETMGLAVPQVTALVNLLRERNYHIKGQVLDVEACVEALTDYLG